MEMKRVKVVSFDVDGTLVHAQFNDLVWLEEMPRLYAEKKGISFESAHRFIVEEYEKVGEKDLRWYDMSYWLRTFGIEKSFSEILRKYEKEIRLYPDVMTTLRALKEHFPMVVITLMPREFLEVKMKKLDGLFSTSFSTISDFNGLKTSDVYREVCSRLNVEADEIVHIGDSWEMDYIEPGKAGIKSFYIDREGKRKGDGVIRSLEELIPILV